MAVEQFYNRFGGYLLGWAYPCFNWKTLRELTRAEQGYRYVTKMRIFEKYALLVGKSEERATDFNFFSIDERKDYTVLEASRLFRNDLDKEGRPVEAYLTHLHQLAIDSLSEDRYDDATNMLEDVFKYLTQGTIGDTFFAPTFYEAADADILTKYAGEDLVAFAKLLTDVVMHAAGKRLVLPKTRIEAIDDDMRDKLINEKLDSVIYAELISAFRRHHGRLFASTSFPDERASDAIPPGKSAGMVLDFTAGVAGGIAHLRRRCAVVALTQKHEEGSVPSSSAPSAVVFSPASREVSASATERMMPISGERSAVRAPGEATTRHARLGKYAGLKITIPIF